MRCSLGLVRGNHLGSIAVLAFAAMVGCGTEEGSSVGTGGAGGASGAGGTGGSGGCAPCTEDGAELADNGCDDNCDGFVDEVISCDSSLTLDTATAVDAVRAMEICRPAMTELDWE